MGVSESDFTKTTCNILQHSSGGGAKVISLVAGKRQEPGLPDRLVYSKDWQGLLEFKVGNNKCSELQKHVIKDLKRHWAKVFVIRPMNWLEVKVHNRTVIIEDENGVEILGNVPISSLLQYLSELK